MFDPDLLSFSILNASTLILSAFGLPAVVLAFLYCAKMRITKIPGGFDVDAEPKDWMLPLFAIACISVTVLVGSTYLWSTLNTVEVDHSGHTSFYSTHILDPSDKPVKNISISISRYDGNSNLRIFANGYRVFSTSSDCAFSYQCSSNPYSSLSESEFAFASGLRDESVRSILRENALPIRMNISHLMLSGINDIEILSDNAGTGGCKIRVSITVESRDNLDAVRHIVVGSLAEKSGNKDELFYPTERNLLHVCKRIRVSIPLSAEQVKGFNDDSRLLSEVMRRRKEEICQILSERQPYCVDPSVRL